MTHRSSNKAKHLGRGAAGGCFGGHALIIEDEILIAMEIEALLDAQGYSSFDIADSPAEALKCALARMPDLITADFRIVGGTGLEAVAVIEARLGQIPTVFVTSNPAEVAGDGRTVVDKPISPVRLAQACRGVVGVV